jgi:hypothetical protein
MGLGCYSLTFEIINNILLGVRQCFTMPLVPFSSGKMHFYGLKFATKNIIFSNILEHPQRARECMRYEILTGQDLQLVILFCLNFASALRHDFFSIC